MLKAARSLAALVGTSRQRDLVLTLLHRRQPWKQQGFRKAADKLEWTKKNGGKLKKTIPSASLEPVSTAVSSSHGSDLLCSYNWVLSEVPLIYVPGPLL
jgi:hypothetical protein